MGIYFLTYDYIVQQTMKASNLEHRSQLSPSVPLLAGASAGIVLWLAIYPIDVIKSYMQTDALSPSERRFKGMGDVIRHVYTSSGVTGFVRGIIPTLIRVCIRLTYRLHSRTVRRSLPSNWHSTNFLVSSLFRQTRQLLGQVLPGAEPTQ